MSKELEALGLVRRTCELYIEKQRYLIGCDIIEKQINEALNTIQNCLEQIDNAKPNEALESLKEISNNYTFQDKTIGFCYEKELDIIKQALLKLDFLEDAMDLPTNCFSIFKNRNDDEVVVMRKEKYEEYEEQKKILKIVFEKIVNIIILELATNVNEYNERMLANSLMLTEEEFNLLKRYCDMYKG